MSFLLLVRFRLPSGATETDWEAFPTVDDAKRRVERLMQLSESYMCGGWHQVGPVLMKHDIFKMERVE